MRTLPFLAIIIGLLVACGIATADSGAKPDAGIRNLIEKAPVSQEAKRALLDKVNEALNAGIPSDDLSVIVGRGLSRSVDGKIIESLIATSVRVKKQNLPVTPVLDRIQQGLSKGAPPERILQAVRRQAEKLADADTVVDNVMKAGVKAESGKEREQAVQAVARALEQSVPHDTVLRIGVSAKKQGRSLRMFNRAVDAMSSFTENGMPVERAAQLVDRAMATGFSERDMARMEMDMADGLREGRKMEDIVQRMEQGHFGQSSKGMSDGHMRRQGAGTGMNAPATGGSHGMGGGSGMRDGSDSGAGMHRR